MVSTVRKSQACVLATCARRKARHGECVRCGAGWRPASSSTFRTDVAETLLPPDGGDPAPLTTAACLHRRDLLGGLIHEYEAA